ncbi:hypothetical protein [Fibrobacter sp.]|uniref:hypothetical protein n=1 Tax=Fibrobacter sp. TaxID=35828 RepID=UPI0038905810
MKYINKFSVLAALTASSILLFGCGGGGGGGTAASDENLREYLESAEMRSDLDNLAEFAYLAEYLQVAPIAFMSSEDGFFTDSVDQEEAEEYAEVMSKMLSKVDQYEAAWTRIDSMQALVSETPNSLKKVEFFKSMKDFFRSLTGCGKATREKVMAVAGELDKSEWKILFDHLEPNQKKGETDYLSWWKNFNNGEYDDISLHIYNVMYYNEDTGFSHEAEFINKTVAKMGDEMTKKAAKFEVEIFKLATPDAVSDAMDMVDKVDKTLNLVTNGKDMSADELKDQAASLLIDGYDDVKTMSEMAGEDVEMVSNLANKVIDKTKEALGESSVVTLTDQGSGALDGGAITIAIGEATGKVTIALGANEDGEHQVVLKEEGPHLVSFMNGKGEKFTKKVEAEPGKKIELEGEMNEKEIRDDAASSKSKFGKSSSSEEPEEESSSSVEEESSSSMEVSKDVKSIYGRWVAAKDVFIYKVTDEAQCQEVKNAMSEIYDGVYDGLYQGLGEYASMMAEDCENKEVPQNTVSGQKILFYSDGSLDCLDGNGELLGSYDYTFDESTGIFSYESSEGEKSTGQVSADGTTLVFETVTDMGYKTITHRVIFEKESGEIE